MRNQKKWMKYLHFEKKYDTVSRLFSEITANIGGTNLSPALEMRKR